MEEDLEILIEAEDGPPSHQQNAEIGAARAAPQRKADREATLLSLEGLQQGLNDSHPAVVLKTVSLLSHVIQAAVFAEQQQQTPGEPCAVLEAYLRSSPRATEILLLMPATSDGQTNRSTLYTLFRCLGLMYRYVTIREVPDMEGAMISVSRTLCREKMVVIQRACLCEYQPLMRMALWLLGCMAESSAVACQELLRAFDFSSKSFLELASRRTAPAKIAHSRKLVAGGDAGPPTDGEVAVSARSGAGKRRTASLREYFTRFILSLFSGADWQSVRSIIHYLKDVVALIFKRLPADPAALRTQVLQTMRDCVVLNRRILLKDRLVLFRESVLVTIAQLFQQEIPTVSALAAEILEVLCTHKELGLLDASPARVLAVLQRLSPLQRSADRSLVFLILKSVVTSAPRRAMPSPAQRLLSHRLPVLDLLPTFFSEIAPPASVTDPKFQKLVALLVDVLQEASAASLPSSSLFASSFEFLCPAAGCLTKELLTSGIVAAGDVPPSDAQATLISRSTLRLCCLLCERLLAATGTSGDGSVPLDTRASWKDRFWRFMPDVSACIRQAIGDAGRKPVAATGADGGLEDLFRYLSLFVQLFPSVVEDRLVDVGQIVAAVSAAGTMSSRDATGLSDLLRACRLDASQTAPFEFVFMMKDGVEGCDIDLVVDMLTRLDCVTHPLLWALSCTSSEDVGFLAASCARARRSLLKYSKISMTHILLLSSLELAGFERLGEGSAYLGRVIRRMLSLGFLSERGLREEFCNPILSRCSSEEGRRAIRLLSELSGAVPAPAWADEWETRWHQSLSSSLWNCLVLVYFARARCFSEEEEDDGRPLQQPVAVHEQLLFSVLAFPPPQAVHHRQNYAWVMCSIVAAAISPTTTAENVAAETASASRHLGDARMLSLAKEKIEELVQTLSAEDRQKVDDGDLLLSPGGGKDPSEERRLKKRMKKQRHVVRFYARIFGLSVSTLMRVVLCVCPSDLFCASLALLESEKGGSGSLMMAGHEMEWIVGQRLRLHDHSSLQKTVRALAAAAPSSPCAAQFAIRFMLSFSCAGCSADATGDSLWVRLLQLMRLSASAAAESIDLLRLAIRILQMPGCPSAAMELGCCYSSLLVLLLETDVRAFEKELKHLLREVETPVEEIRWTGVALVTLLLKLYPSLASGGLADCSSPMSHITHKQDVFWKYFDRIAYHVVARLLPADVSKTGGLWLATATGRCLLDLLSKMDADKRFLTATGVPLLRKPVRWRTAECIRWIDRCLLGQIACSVVQADRGSPEEERLLVAAEISMKLLLRVLQVFFYPDQRQAGKIVQHLLLSTEFARMGPALRNAAPGRRISATGIGGDALFSMESETDSLVRGVLHRVLSPEVFAPAAWAASPDAGVADPLLAYVRLLVFCCRLPSPPATDSSPAAVDWEAMGFLCRSVYTGSLSAADVLLFDLLQEMNDRRQCTWTWLGLAVGPQAEQLGLEYFASLRESEAQPLGQRSMGPALLELRRVMNCLHFFPYSAGQANGSEDAYDPRFLLLFAHYNFLDANRGNEWASQRYIETGLLSVVICCLSTAAYKLQAASFLEMFRRRVREREIWKRHKEQVLSVLDHLANSQKDATSPCSSLVAMFCAEAVMLALKPENVMYAPVLSMMEREPDVPLNAVVNFLQSLLVSTEFAVADRYRDWALRFLVGHRFDMLGDSRVASILSKKLRVQQWVGRILFSGPAAFTSTTEPSSALLLGDLSAGRIFEWMQYFVGVEGGTSLRRLRGLIPLALQKRPEWATPVMELTRCMARTASSDSSGDANAARIAQWLSGMLLPGLRHISESLCLFYLSHSVLQAWMEDRDVMRMVWASCMSTDLLWKGVGAVCDEMVDALSASGGDASSRGSKTLVRAMFAHCVLILLFASRRHAGVESGDVHRRINRLLDSAAAWMPSFDSAALLARRSLLRCLDRLLDECESEHGTRIRDTYMLFAPFANHIRESRHAAAQQFSHVRTVSPEAAGGGGLEPARKKRKTDRTLVGSESVDGLAASDREHDDLSI